MQRRSNPLGLFEVGISLVLVSVGLGGLVMGRLAMARDDVTPGPTPGPEPEPTPEPTIPKVGELLSEMRSWMEVHYPGTQCFRKGWARGWSVTGPEDGFNLEWEIYERPSDGRWILVYEYQHPAGFGRAADPYWSSDDAFNRLNEIEVHGFKEYKERQAYRGDPFVPKSPSTGVYAC